MDTSFVEDVVNHLFEAVSGQGGLDLTALNIQRGRDHGIPGYNEYRQKCDSSILSTDSANDFSSFTLLSKKNREMLEEFYKHADDVDLFIGGILERRVGDSILGPTFRCIIGEQFLRLKRGDRFWYENGGFSEYIFSESQLAEIRKSTMARILCDNTDINMIQQEVFKIVGEANPLIYCSNKDAIPKINLDLF